MSDNLARDVTLTARADALPDKLRVTYAVSNNGKPDVYVLDVFPAVDPKERKAYADVNGAFICLGSDGKVQLLKGIPPLPGDRTVAVRVIPLGTKLAPGAKLERTFELPLPLREQSPYYGTLDAKDYEELRARDFVLTVELLRGDVEGFKAEPADFAPEYFRVQSKNVVGQAERMVCPLSAGPVKVLKRKDRFRRI